MAFIHPHAQSYKLYIFLEDLMMEIAIPKAFWTIIKFFGWEWWSPAAVFVIEMDFSH